MEDSSYVSKKSDVMLLLIGDRNGIICCGNPVNLLCSGKCMWEWEVSQLPFFPFCIFATFDLEFLSYWVKLFLVNCSKTFKYLCLFEH